MNKNSNKNQFSSFLIQKYELPSYHPLVGGLTDFGIHNRLYVLSESKTGVSFD